METILGWMDFNTGFKKEDNIVFCGETKSIIIKVKAYFEKDGISQKQVETLKRYNENKAAIQEMLSGLAEKFDKNAKNRFIPKTLLVGRTGECALLCDDKEDSDGGIAISVYPEQKIISQDDYL